MIKMNVQLRTPHATSRRFNSKSESTGQPADDDESRDDGETDTSSPVSALKGCVYVLR